jgi:hypothetical protein
MKRWDKVDPPEHVSRAHIIAHSERLSRGKTDFFDEDPEAPSIQPSGAATPNETSQEPLTDDVQRLQRENLWLRLEAGYADRLRKQYLYREFPFEIELMAELGRLHKNSMRFSVDEAEVHSFVSLLLESVSEPRRIESKRNDRQGMPSRMSWHNIDEMQFRRSRSTRNGKSRYAKS